MALQKINLTQIDTIPSSGTTIVFGSHDSPISAIFVETMDISGSLEVGGNLIVRGETTIIESTVIQIDDNIIELNGTGGAFGGLMVKDITSPNTQSGSLLWDSINDKWIAGVLGVEKSIIIGDGTENFLQKIESSGSLVNSRISDNGNIIILSGDTLVRGNLTVEGKTTLVQKNNINEESLIISGTMKVVQNLINSQIISASLQISGLGTLSSNTSNNEIDLGGFY
jgi:hypothetical protein